MLKTDRGTARLADAEHGLRSDARQLREDVGQLHEDLVGLGARVGEVARSGVAAATECANEAVEAVKRKGRRATGSVSDGIARHPWAILGIAVGVGLVIGLIGPAIVRARRR